jgi:1-pyrroline-5-carboxylate dehydrogenase
LEINIWNTKPRVPCPVNEPELEYNPGSDEREELQKELRNQYQNYVEIPIIIAGEKLYTGNTRSVICPHDHQHQLGVCHQAGKQEIKRAIEASMEARRSWSNLPWHQRLSPFLKMAHLLSQKYRYKINAVTMLNQSKSVHQAEKGKGYLIVKSCHFLAKYFLASL